MNDCTSCCAKGICCEKYKNVSCKAMREIVVNSYNQALKEFGQKLMSKIREDTCGCAHDARVIIRDTFNQMYK